MTYFLLTSNYKLASRFFSWIEQGERGENKTLKLMRGLFFAKIELFCLFSVASRVGESGCACASGTVIVPRSRK
jgi:hypothetical protein